MRRQIEVFPPRGVSIYRRNYGMCTAIMFKDPQNEIVNEGKILTANIEKMELTYSDGLQEELENNFDVNFERARLIGLEIAKFKALAEIKESLISTGCQSWKHSDAALTDAEYEPTKTKRAELRTLYRAVETAKTTEKLKQIYPQLKL